jgi:hypothetical protein
MKDVQVTGDAFSPQKRTYSLSGSGPVTHILCTFPFIYLKLRNLNENEVPSTNGKRQEMRIGSDPFRDLAQNAVLQL